MDTNLLQELEKNFNKAIASNQIHEAVLFVENTNGDFSYGKGYGGKDIGSPLLMASITKLFATTCILALREQGKLSLDDKIAKYFEDSVLDGLHIYKGNDTLSWEESFIVAAKFALENRKTIYHVHNSMQREELEDYIYNVSGNVMIRYVEKVSDGISASSGDEKLIASGMKEGPDTIVRRIGQLFDRHIALSLKRNAGLNNVW